MERSVGQMKQRVGRSKYFRFDGWYLRVRRERLLGGFSGRRLTHPGLAGFPTPSTLHPRWYGDVGGMTATSVDARMLAVM